MSNTLTRLGLSEAVVREVGLSRNESGKLAESVIRHISNAVASGEKVMISSFGTFQTRATAPRTGRNPSTGELVAIPPSRALTFHPSSRLNKRVAAGSLE